MSLEVAVIIPTINEQALIGQAIVAAQAAGAAEVIVCDGGSHDGTLRIARQLDARVVQTSPGRGLQQNAGAATALSSVLLFQHADCWLDPNSLRQLRDALSAQPQRVAGAFRQQLDPPMPFHRLLAAGNAVRVRCLGLAYGDQGIFIRREVFARVGGYPEVPLMEDVALMQRLRRHGHHPLLLLDGPLHVSTRRWQHTGLVRQTARNWSLLAAFHCGVSPASLARFYRRHDQSCDRSGR